MTMIGLDVELTDEERTIRDTIHKFAAQILRPIGEKLDKLADPQDVIATSSPLWGVFEKYRELGLDVASIASSGLAPVQQARVRAIVAEEIGWGDTGLGTALAVADFPGMMARMTGKPELIERFGADDCIGCWAGTEPDHGSDLIVYMNKPELAAKALSRPNCIARKDGDSFVLNGQKAAWVSNGTIANAAALFCAVDMGDGKPSSGGFVVPLDVPGVSRGKPLDKIGQRALNQGEIYFDDVRIPADYMTIGPDLYGFALESILCQANSGMGSSFTGLAQAALDLALDYARQRVQGGKPIIEHQNVKARLFEMFRKVEAARALNRRVVLYNSLSSAPQLQYAIASKVTSTETAFEVASAALQIFGGNGLAREYPIEKLLRDARASMIEDGCNEVLSLVGADRL